MNLKNYLDYTRKDGESLDSRCMRFAQQLGVAFPTVRKWVYGQRRINDAMKIKIMTLTRGLVSIEDMVRS
jgi:DNA-binding transcriptional regulator YdaS (Cro superfamily)